MTDQQLFNGVQTFWIALLFFSCLLTYATGSSFMATVAAGAAAAFLMFSLFVLVAYGR